MLKPSESRGPGFSILDELMLLFILPNWVINSCWCAGEKGKAACFSFESLKDSSLLYPWDLLAFVGTRGRDRSNSNNNGNVNTTTNKTIIILDLKAAHLQKSVDCKKYG